MQKKIRISKIIGIRNLVTKFEAWRVLGEQLCVFEGFGVGAGGEPEIEVQGCEAGIRQYFDSQTEGKPGNILRNLRRKGDRQKAYQMVACRHHLL